MSTCAKKAEPRCSAQRLHPNSAGTLEQRAALRACSLKQGDAEQGLEKPGQAAAALEPDRSSG